MGARVLVAACSEFDEGHGKLSANRLWDSAIHSQLQAPLVPDAPLASDAPDRLTALLNPLRLAALANGAAAQVAGFAAASGGLAARMMELGLEAGVQVEILHRGPFGNPLAVRVGGAVVAMRRAEAELVLVEDISEQKIK